MPKKQRTPCGHSGCPELSRDYYCEKHKKEATRKEVAGRRDRIAIYNTARWRRLRMWHLRRFPLCARCGGAANTVDHVTPIEMGGDEWDIKNLQTLCFDCHQQKRAKEAQMIKKGVTYRDQAARVTLVCGPPAGGKTLYVRDRAQHGDLVVDLDRIMIALSGLPKYDKPQALLPFALTAYDAVLALLSREIGDVRHAWVIKSAPRRQDRHQLCRMLNADLVILDTDVETCLRRIADDPLRSAQRKQWEILIRKWWSDYEPEHKEKIWGGEGQDRNQ